jgi:hypothetical protein
MKMVQWKSILEHAPMGEVLAINSKGDMLVGYILKDLHDYECQSDAEVLCDVTHFIQADDLRKICNTKRGKFII